MMFNRISNFRPKKLSAHLETVRPEWPPEAEVSTAALHVIKSWQLHDGLSNFKAATKKCLRTTTPNMSAKNLPPAFNAVS